MFDFFRNSYEMSVDFQAKSTFFSIVLQICGSISVKYRLSLKSSWLQHLVLKHKGKKKKGNIIGSKYILLMLEHNRGAMEQYKHPLLRKMPP